MPITIIIDIYLPPKKIETDNFDFSTQEPQK